MSKPRIRFFTGARGQRIAYALSGSGPPLVLPAWWVSHVERDWENERFRAFFEPLSAHYTVVRYDRPGVGLSVRERSDFTLESEVATLESLIEHLGFDRASLMGFSCGGPPAVIYTERHPARIDRLVLVNSYAYGPDLAPPKLVHALVDLVDAHWGLGAQTIADLFAPDLERSRARDLARSQHDWASAELAARLLELSFEMDCREAASRVATPSLILHRRRDHTVQLSAGRDLAARLRDAEFVTIEGNAHVPWEGEVEPVVNAVLEFLGTSSDTRSAGTDQDQWGDDVWRKEGELWRVRFAGRSVHLPNRKGLEDLAVLLANPLHEFLAIELVSGADTDDAHRGASGSDAVLDDRARSELARRARAIEAELDDANSRHDLGRAEALMTERETLLAELGRAVGLGGRARRLNDPAERARKAVSARIRESIRRIRDVHPDLAEHLEASITTGSSCAYRPETSRSWHTT